MTEEMRSRVLGMILGSVSRGHFPQREPVAFLYGHVAKEGETPDVYIGDVGYVGAVLPKLPEWDREKYPFAGIECFKFNDTTRYHFFAHEYQNYWYDAVDTQQNWYGNEMDENGNPTRPNAVLYLLGDASEVRYDDWTLSSGNVWNVAVDRDKQMSSSTIVWTNFKLKYSDGSVMCNASDPIPIYK